MLEQWNLSPSFSISLLLLLLGLPMFLLRSISCLTSLPTHNKFNGRSRRKPFSFFWVSITNSTNNTKENEKKRVVFLGTPQVVVPVLDKLMDASKTPESVFELAAIVTQPPSARQRGKRVMASPIAEHALVKDFPQHLIFTPEKTSEGGTVEVRGASELFACHCMEIRNITKAPPSIYTEIENSVHSKYKGITPIKFSGHESFLADFKALKPGLCVTAAYGNILPRKFLEVPECGTVNIHPSLLPLYRGAAPVQRALQDGVKETGVSLAYTVLALDAGPVIASEKIEVDDHTKAPELLSDLFNRGSELLMSEMPFILDGSAMLRAQKQDDSLATTAPKVKPEESWLSFEEEAFKLHNKVRGFAGWPGTRTKIEAIDDKGHVKVLEFKIITTRVGIYGSKDGRSPDDEYEIFLNEGALVFPCAKSTFLEVLELQLPGKKAVSARAFWNGLRGMKLQKCR